VYGQIPNVFAKGDGAKVIIINLALLLLILLIFECFSIVRNTIAFLEIQVVREILN